MKRAIFALILWLATVSSVFAQDQIVEAPKWYEAYPMLVPIGGAVILVLIVVGIFLLVRGKTSAKK